MSRTAWTILFLTVGGCALVMAVMRRAPTTVPPDELARRCAASRPTWQDYEENIKAQIGATPAAEWAGTLHNVSRQGRFVRITWRLAPPWNERRVAIPMLLKEPRGAIVLNREVEWRGGSPVYVFQLPEGMDDAPLPWIEIKYPHGEQRLVLYDDGSWAAS